MLLIGGQKIDSSAERLSNTLKEINFENERKRAEIMNSIKENEKQRQLFLALESQNIKLQEIVGHILNTGNANTGKIKEIESSIRKEIDSSNKTIEMTMPGYFIDVKAFKKLIEDIRNDFKILLDKYQVSTSQDVGKKILTFEKSYNQVIEQKFGRFLVDYNDILNKDNVVDRKESEEIVKKFLNELKIDYAEIINKPNLLNREEVNQLILDYSKKIDGLFQVELKLSKAEINNLEEKLKEIQRIEKDISKKIELLEKENKRLETKINNTTTYYSNDGGYDYATVRMTRMNFITSNYPASSSDFGIMVNATSGAITVTLPSAIKTGQVISVKKIDSSTNTVTIVPSGSETIEGSSSIVLSAQYESKWVVAGGNSIWYVVSSTGAAGIGTETPVGTKDGVNTTYTVSHIPAFMNLNGQIFYEGSGYSRSGLTITMDLAPYSTDLFVSHY